MERDYRFVGPFYYSRWHVRETVDNTNYDYALPGDAFEESAKWWREKYPELIERIANPRINWPHFKFK